jgi:hypothetical protein
VTRAIRRSKAAHPLVVFSLAGHGISETIAWNQFHVPGNLQVSSGPLSTNDLKGLPSFSIHTADLVDRLQRRGCSRPSCGKPWPTRCGSGVGAQGHKGRPAGQAELRGLAHLLGWGLFGGAVTPRIALATLVLHLLHGTILGWGGARVRRLATA